MMKSETLLHHPPITPPNANVELHSGLHEVAQYNDKYSTDDSHRYSSAYASPEAGVHDTIPHAAQPYPTSHVQNHPGEYGHDGQYDGYRHNSAQLQEGHFDQIQHNQTMFAGSPPTPSSAIDHRELRTRSGRNIVPSSSPQTPAKSRPKAIPKSKKAKAGKGDKPKTPKLTAALSILTKDMTSVPVRDMEAWVNRSVETRYKEVEKRNGYITRPMNSFMLYRSAYAERTKQWCLQNNHQVVSSVSGESWPMEPQEIRDRFNEYAKIERINHQNAHPDYKFSPSKAATPARKRKADYDDESDMDDTEWAPGHGRRRPAKRPEHGNGYPSTAMTAEFFDQSFRANGLQRPMWEMHHEGRPIPMPMQGDPYHHQYYQTGVHPNMNMPPGMMEDMRMRRVDTPGSSMQFSSGHAMLGLPGGNASDMMQHLHSHGGTPLGDEGQVDPMLLAFDGSHHQDMEPAMLQHPEFRNHHLGLMERELEEESVHSLLTNEAHDEFHNENWHHDPHMSSMEQGSEFEKWMDDGHGG